MVAADRDRRPQLTPPNKFVNCFAHLCAFTITKPTNSRRQTLKLHPIAREPQPAIQSSIIREKFQCEIVGLANVFGFAGQRDPTKRSFAFAEKWANVFR